MENTRYGFLDWLSSLRIGYGSCEDRNTTWMVGHFLTSGVTISVSRTPTQRRQKHERKQTLAAVKSAPKMKRQSTITGSWLEPCLTAAFPTLARMKSTAGKYKLLFGVTCRYSTPECVWKHTKIFPVKKRILTLMLQVQLTSTEGANKCKENKCNYDTSCFVK